MRIIFNCFRFITFLGCFLLAGDVYSQSNILVTYNSGSGQAYYITATGKLYFDNDNLIVLTSDASAPASISTSLIRKVTFPFSVLPLNLLQFTVRNETAQVTLAWKTSGEINTSHFVVERSSTLTGYDSIGRVATLNSASGSDYSFVDRSPENGISYYRLKQVDADGRYVYSRILSVNRTASTNLVLLPNPAKGYFMISSASSEKLSVKIYSVAGQLLVSGIYAPGEQIAVDKLTPGMYVVFINDKSSYKFIKE